MGEKKKRTVPAPYYVYMVTCGDGSLYTGITTDTLRRIEQHNGILPGGAAYTRSRRPVTLCFVEPCASKGEALQREMQIKKLSRAKKKSLYQSHEQV